MNDSSIYVCGICGNSSGNHIFKIKEMQLGLFEDFDYFECSLCKCIQIVKIPEDISRFYPSDYYSYHDPKQIKIPLIRIFTRTAKKALVLHCTGKYNPVGFLLSLFYKDPFPWLTQEMCDFNKRILDVGCGSGGMLFSLERSGFNNLTGIDPFIKKNMNSKGRVRIFKKNLAETEGEFDLIMFHHSFEHMTSPAKVLEQTYNLLSPGGSVLIRIPVTGGYAWRKYRDKWIQLDAPRHIFIYSVQSLEILCRQTKFRIEKIVYDSVFTQFTGSQKYTLGIPLMSDDISFTKSQLRSFRKEAKKLNSIMDGDAACFYLKKQN